MKDYYKILGIDEEASGEEIRARWIELTKRYHPDLSQGSDYDENIKEINEAYEVLKDFSKRLDYDLERALKKSFIKKAHSRKERRSHIQKVILPVGLLVFLLIVGLVIFKWFHVAKTPQSEVPYEIEKILEKKTPSQIPPVKTEPEVKVEKVVTPTLPPVEKESKPKEELVPQVVMKTERPVKIEISKEVAKEIPKEVPQNVPKEVPKEAPKEIRKEKPPSPTLPPVEKESKPKEELVPQVVKKSEMPVKVEIPKEIPKVAPLETDKVAIQESAKTDKPKPIVMEPPPVQKPEPSVKAERVVSLPPPRLAKEEEVRQFFADYAGQYGRKDMKGFLSLFSPKAIQNQKEGLDEIGKIYTNFFDQSQELQYHMEDAKIEIYQNRVEVKARFKVNQILKKRGGEKIWKGNIRWVLIKEDGILKIITLDYQNEKSP